MKSKINITYFIILAVLALSFLIFLAFAILFIFKDQIIVNITSNDSDKGIINDIITHTLAAISAVMVYIAFKGGQKQTKISLAINQFNIFHNEFKDLLEEGRKMKFRSYINDKELTTFKNAYAKSNGIDYIALFHPPFVYTGQKNNSESEKNRVDDYTHNVLFPLLRYYDKLLHFIQRIETDEILSDEHKKILYIYIERDILYIYFRICNNTFGNQKFIRLDIFNNKVTNTEQEFHKINEFFINRNLFSYKNLEFYQKNF